MAKIACPFIEYCKDGKAPYLLPGACCLECGTLQQNKVPMALYRNCTNISSSPAYLESMRSILEPDRKRDDWGEWTAWTRCSEECGGGRQSRMRDCIVKDRAAINCTGERVQLQDCNTHHCPSECAVANCTI